MTRRPVATTRTDPTTLPPPRLSWVRSSVGPTRQRRPSSATRPPTRPAARRPSGRRACRTLHSTPSSDLATLDPPPALLVSGLLLPDNQPRWECPCLTRTERCLPLTPACPFEILLGLLSDRRPLPRLLPLTRFRGLPGTALLQRTLRSLRRTSACSVVCAFASESVWYVAPSPARHFISSKNRPLHPSPIRHHFSPAVDDCSCRSPLAHALLDSSASPSLHEPPLLSSAPQLHTYIRRTFPYNSKITAPIATDCISQAFLSSSLSRRLYHKSWFLDRSVPFIKCLSSPLLPGLVDSRPSISHLSTHIPADGERKSAPNFRLSCLKRRQKKKWRGCRSCRSRPARNVISSCSLRSLWSPSSVQPNSSTLNTNYHYYYHVLRHHPNHLPISRSRTVLRQQGRRRRHE